MNDYNVTFKREIRSMIIRITILWLLSLGICLLVVAPASAREVVDLEKWAKAGLPESVRERMVIQSLTQRARPPLSGDFLLSMVRYGGEGLALKYMSLDAATAQEAEAPLTPESVSRLIGAGVPRADLERIVDLAGAAPNAVALPAPVPAALRPVAEYTVEDLGPVTDEPRADATPAVAPTAPAPPARLETPRAPEAPAIPAAARPLTRDELRKIPQVLVPGVPADPARPMPPEPGPYQIRKPQGSTGVFMGVQEEVKPDGHVYRVNTNGRKELLGAEVISRPSGHKIHRYFSGRTDQTQPDYEANENYDDGYGD